MPGLDEFDRLLSSPGILESESRFGLWEGVVNATGASNILEVGVWRGEFASHILERCESVRRYYMIDPWRKLDNWNKPNNVSAREFEKIYAEAMQRTQFASGKRRVLRGCTGEVIDQIPDASLDIAYIDGDHTLRGILIDLIKIAPKVRPEGFIGGDDFVLDPWQHGAGFEPTLVCPVSIYFAEAMNFPLSTLPHQQFIMQKRTDSRLYPEQSTAHLAAIEFSRKSLAASASRTLHKLRRYVSDSSFRRK